MSAWSEHVWTDRDGHAVRPRTGDRDLCLACGAVCEHLFEGLSFHPEHWVGTTAAEREQASRRALHWIAENPEAYEARLA
ncbi:hypothetical protein, partial [Kineococcus indalonis]|uniref:hypothetical protein n=1 Tax=Kineococcus indalonis TaxID=2696566 RepID=UPI0014126042